MAHPDTGAARHTPAPTPSRSAPAGSPLAGRIGHVRAARPQTGLGAADVVYMERRWRAA
ncbi:hypothetical protein ACWC4C_06690 [Streptomyces olivaceoviridis]